MTFFWISNIFHISSTSNLSSFTISGQFLHLLLDILVNVHCSSYCRLSLAIWQTLYWFKIHDIGCSNLILCLDCWKTNSFPRENLSSMELCGPWVVKNTINATYKFQSFMKHVCQFCFWIIRDSPALKLNTISSLRILLFWPLRNYPSDSYKHLDSKIK